MIRSSAVRIPMESIYQCSNGNRFSDDVSAETIERYFTAMESKTSSRIPSFSARDEKKIERLDPLENFIRRGSYNSVLVMLSKGTKPESKHGMMAIKYGTDVEIFKLLTEAKMEITPSMIHNAISLRKKFIYKWIFEKKRIPVTSSYFDHLIREEDDETCMEYIELRSQHQSSSKVDVELRSQHQLFSMVDVENIELTAARLNLAIQYNLKRLTSYLLAKDIIPSKENLETLLVNKDDDNFCAGLVLLSNDWDSKRPSGSSGINRSSMRENSSNMAFGRLIFSNAIAAQRIKPILACINLKLPFNTKDVPIIHRLKEDIRPAILDSFYDAFYYEMTEVLLNDSIWSVDYLWIQENLNRCIDLQNIDEDYFLKSEMISLFVYENNKEGRLNYYLKIQSYRIAAINKLKEGLLDGTDMCVDVINIVISYLFRN